MYKIIVVGIDQSYKNTGITIAGDGKILKIKSINLERFKSNTEKREKLRSVLKNMLEKIKNKAEKIICVIERIRLYSKGFLNINYIKSIGALNSIIIDVMSLSNIQTYSVDTRCWKSAICGTSKGKKNNFGVPEEKYPMVEFLIKKGFADKIKKEIKSNKKKTGFFIENDKKYFYDNDMADSAGIALFYFKGDKNKLKEEK